MAPKKKAPLYKHQKKSIKTILSNSEGIVFDTSDPGTGKTRVQIEVMVSRMKENPGVRALIVAPKSLLSAVWENDVRKFAPHLSVSIARAGHREQAFAADTDICVINTDGVVWLASQPKRFLRGFDILVIDEIADFKHKTSARSKALAKIAPLFTYRAGLTGTPNTNSITELWHQVKILDGGQRLGRSFVQFRNAVCTPVQVGPKANHLSWEDKESAPDVVTNLLSDITIRNVFEECVDIPAQTTHIVPYTLTAKQLAAYRMMEDSTLAELDSGVIISAANGAVVMTKLLQIASGAAYSEFDTGHTAVHRAAANALGYALLDKDRYELICELVSARDHSVVFFNWDHQRQQLEKVFKAKKIRYAVIAGDVPDKERAQIVLDYDKGLYDVLLAHPQSAAHGLTLTRGRAVIWASPTANLQHFIQGNRRVYRIGQKHKTEVILVMAENTIEQYVFDKLTDKNTRQMKVLDLLGDYHKSR